MRQHHHQTDPEVARLRFTAAALGRLCLTGPAAAEVLARQLEPGPAADRVLAARVHFQRAADDLAPLLRAIVLECAGGPEH